MWHDFLSWPRLRLRFHSINFAINLFLIPKQIVRTHSYIIFLYYTKKGGFNRCAGNILAPTNSTVVCGDSTCPPICRHKSCARLLDSCQVVVVCYSLVAVFVCLSCFFVCLAYMKWIRHPIHWKIKALVYWRVTRRAIMGGPRRIARVRETDSDLDDRPSAVT